MIILYRHLCAYQMSAKVSVWLFVVIVLLSCIKSGRSDTFSDLKSQFWSQFRGKEYDENASNIIPESDVRGHHRKIWIITTACLPWMTGTSINPLLRAAYFAKDRPIGHVHLMVPWLDKTDQEIAYPPGVRFNHPSEQEEYVRNWLIQEAHLPAAAQKLEITFYAASYHDEFHSIFPMGDITALIPDAEADICILEEPEHLNWYKAPFTAKAWMDKFQHVVGIIHTNYLSYTRADALGQIKEPLVYYINQGVCRAYCHKIIKLSGALQEFAAEKEVICNVHGVRTKYLSIGDHTSAASFTKGAYFVGKMAWPKGLGELFTLMDYVKQRTGRHFPVDIYGTGPHFSDIRDTAARRGIPAQFFGGVDHALLKEYKVFVNPSLSEVLCTTIVEALAMGKWVVCAKHPSNEFFEQFPNCLTFRNEEEFAANMFWALNNTPRRLTPAQRHSLSWEAAMQRFETAALLTVAQQRNSKTYYDGLIAWAIEVLGSGKYGDALRVLAGGGRAANQIEYTTRYGSASVPTPADPTTANTDVQEAVTVGDHIHTNRAAQLGNPGSDLQSNQNVEKVTVDIANRPSNAGDWQEHVAARCSDLYPNSEDLRRKTEDISSGLPRK